MTALLSHPLIAASGSGDCLHDRLAEARCILADVAQHPISLIILAYRTIAAHGIDDDECADAMGLWQLLDPRPLPAIMGAAAAAIPNGGAA